MPSRYLNKFTYFICTPVTFKSLSNPSTKYVNILVTGKHFSFIESKACFFYIDLKNASLQTKTTLEVTNLFITIFSSWKKMWRSHMLSKPLKAELWEAKFLKFNFDLMARMIFNKRTNRLYFEHTHDDFVSQFLL